MFGELLCFSTAMSPNSPCRNHNWLPPLGTIEQGWVQTRNKSVVAGGLLEQPKYSKPLSNPSLWAIPTFSTVNYPICYQIPAYQQLSIPCLYTKFLLLRSQRCGLHGMTAVCQVDPSSAINSHYKTSPHVMKESCFPEATRLSRSRSCQARISKLLRFTQTVNN